MLGVRLLVATKSTGQPATGTHGWGRPEDRVIGKRYPSSQAYFIYKPSRMKGYGKDQSARVSKELESQRDKRVCASHARR